MRFLFDLGHPAHLHFFRNVVARLADEGHRIRITARNKDILVELANNYGMDVEVFGTCRKGVVNMGLELLYRQWRLQKIIRQFKPDAMMAIAGTYISALGKLFRVPVYIFYDTEHATLSNLLAYPFATCIYVPKCYRKRIRWNHQLYNGYHELAYLHPRYFKPDPAVLRDVSMKPGDRFTIIRFVGWGAVHDVGRAGFTDENKIRAVRELQRYGRVFISCEGDMPTELEAYRLRLDVTRIHDLMAHAALIFGESATMVSEGAVLGVPGIYLDPVGRGYTDEQERDYGLVFNFGSRRQDEAIAKGVEVLSNGRRKDWRVRGQRLVEDKIDVTELVWRVISERPSA